ncbi:hypothetical protein [Chitinophaga sancti]|uniref:Uncharacterized protein n=1 Tax=Chitinophaga sancti TaxID=1004 RepID=A0A1K1SCH5_9BACT|nr:hypothetical protein [Chitinophaga sancti]WQD63606.1 hypothetical protein U0033_04305 [Chitinophaga sancti]WQG90769.1 hypothetical protein SR876_04615 [Chitinophaga sancti]SFW82006.1 hypothetical protein SAMN05661012_05179 [Chitinophaga sancti]
MRHFILIALVMLSLRATAQVSMTVQLPPTGVMQRAQLWNILLVSGSTSPILVQVEIRVTDARTNQPVLTGASRTFVLNKGAKQLQVGDVSPVSYEYLSAAADRSANGMLTAGSYLACYTVIRRIGDAWSVIGEDCIPFAVEPVSPPILNAPANESIVEESLPQFSWLPPAPQAIFSDLNYDFTIVELRNGQSAAEAIQQNIPVYRAAYNKNMFLNYPASAVQLDTAKKYAWTVVANNGNQFAAQAEIWTFKLKGVHAEKINIEEAAYVQLKRGLDAPLVTCSGTLQLSYSNDPGDNTVKYEIINLDESKKVVQSGMLSLNRGPNQLKVVLNNSFTTGHSYLFHILNGRLEYWNTKFIYNKK